MDNFFCKSFFAITDNMKILAINLNTTCVIFPTMDLKLKELFFRNGSSKNDVKYLHSSFHNIVILETSTFQI